MHRTHAESHSSPTAVPRAHMRLGIRPRIVLWCAGCAGLALWPSQALTQAAPADALRRSSIVSAQPTARSPQQALRSPWNVDEEREATRHRLVALPPAGSAGRTIAIHGIVGAGTGFVIGLLLSGSSISDDQSTIVLTWTGLGAAAGVISGVATWVLNRRPSAAAPPPGTAAHVAPTPQWQPPRQSGPTGPQQNL